MERTSVSTQLEANAPKIAYLVSRFPKISETFVLYEMLALRKQGAKVDLFALKREHQETTHNEAKSLLPNVGFCSPLNPVTWADAAKQIIRTPLLALKVATEIVIHNRRSMRYLVTSLAALPSAFALSWRLQRRGYTHVHAHFANVPTVIAFAVKRLTGIPYSFTAHGSDLHRDQTMLAEKVAASKAAITVSEFNLQIMQGLVAPLHQNKLRVIHCGADPTVFKPDCAKPKRIADICNATDTRQVIELGCLGSLLPVKGQGVLLESLELLSKTTDVRINCRLIGDGPSREALEQRAGELGLNVEFTGALTRDQVAKILPTLDIVVAPSVPTSDGRKEGIPVSLMEAMASGCNVIASDLTGIPELVRHEHTGLLVDPGDVQGLALAIQRFVMDADLREHCKINALSLVHSEFSLQANSQQILALITAESG